MEPEEGAGAVSNKAEDVMQIVLLKVDVSLYSKEAVFRACYKFTDRCFLFLTQTALAEISVEFRVHRALPPLEVIVGEFGNELISQKVREDISRETQSIRQLIVAQAFADASFVADVS